MLKSPVIHEDLPSIGGIHQFESILDIVKNETVYRKRLAELQLEKMNQEMRARGYTGDMLVPMLKHRIANEHGASVDLKNLRHQIAFIKQTIKEKKNEKI